jgi:hypothetical protein
MNRLNLCVKQGDEWVPVGPDNPLPIVMQESTAPGVRVAEAVEDLPEKPTVAQAAAAHNELLRVLREAGLLARPD